MFRLIGLASARYSKTYPLFVYKDSKGTVFCYSDKKARQCWSRANESSVLQLCLQSKPSVCKTLRVYWKTGNPLQACSYTRTFAKQSHWAKLPSTTKSAYLHPTRHFICSGHLFKQSFALGMPYKPQLTPKAKPAKPDWQPPVVFAGPKQAKPVVITSRIKASVNSLLQLLERSANEQGREATELLVDFLVTSDGHLQVLHCKAWRSKPIDYNQESPFGLPHVSTMGNIDEPDRGFFTVPHDLYDINKRMRLLDSWSTGIKHRIQLVKAGSLTASAKELPRNQEE